MKEKNSGKSAKAVKSVSKMPKMDLGAYDSYLLPVTIFICTLILSLSVFISASKVSETLTLAAKESQKSAVAGVATGAAGQVIVPSPAAVVPTEPPIKYNKMAIGDNPIKGNSSTATVGIMEFSDYSCSFCQRFHKETYPGLKEKYIDTGKALFIYRDFSIFDPTPAQVGQCVASLYEDKDYYNFHDAIFNGGARFDLAGLLGIVTELGMDSAKVQECITNSGYNEGLKSAEADARTLGLTGTPGFIVGKIVDGNVIDGEVVAGAYPLSEFERIIDSYLE